MLYVPTGVAAAAVCGKGCAATAVCPKGVVAALTGGCVVPALSWCRKINLTSFLLWMAHKTACIYRCRKMNLTIFLAWMAHKTVGISTIQMADNIGSTSHTRSGMVNNISSQSSTVVTYRKLSDLSTLYVCFWSYLYPFSDLASFVENHCVEPKILAKLFNLMLKVYSDSQKFDEALETFNYMRNNGVKINETICTIHLIALVRDVIRLGNMESAFSVFGEMTERDVSPNVDTYYPLVSGLRKVGRMERVNEFVDEILKKELELGQMDKAKTLLSIMVKRSVTFDMGYLQEFSAPPYQFIAEECTSGLPAMKACCWPPTGQGCAPPAKDKKVSAINEALPATSMLHHHSATELKPEENRGSPKASRPSCIAMLGWWPESRVVCTTLFWSATHQEVPVLKQKQFGSLCSVLRSNQMQTEAIGGMVMDFLAKPTEHASFIIPRQSCGSLI
ncbi:hypothetical protein HYC85_031876 [Camellia sinensis]|uniref:PROP1-like PPR domain-containing protein n=1 Tax=Camellia sinensis TaxID=4442 RepID=A0A7J7FRN5_CAMSI|nr:hypothetical protein HYC85_031876 [Camellia sinensis]